MRVYRTLLLVLATTGLVLAAFAATAQDTTQPALATVDHVDLKRYMGTWYEIARLPAPLEKGCYNIKTHYAYDKEQGSVYVMNEFLKYTTGSKLKVLKGKAFVTDTVTYAKLKMRLLWPFKGDYWIIDLAPDYSYAVVGEPSRKYLWILSRTASMSEETYNMLVNRAKEKGFDTNKLIRTEQLPRK